jgi:hypothetical protein
VLAKAAHIEGLVGMTEIALLVDVTGRLENEYLRVEHAGRWEPYGAGHSEAALDFPSKPR